MTKAVFADTVRRVVVEDIEVPPVGADKVKVKTEYSYISAGTELTALQMGNVNLAQPVERRQMGYSLSGHVIEAGKNAAHVKEGDAVACVGAGAYHAAEVVVGKNLVVPVPERCSMRAAAMSAMACFSLEGVRKANIGFGENVLVAGGGLMGHMASRYASPVAGCTILLEKNRSRLGKTSENIIGLGPTDDVWDRIAEITAPYGVEKVLFCMGGDATSLLDNVKKVMSKSPEGIQHGDIVFSGGATIKVAMASPSGNLRLISSAKAGPGYRDEAFENGREYPSGYVKWTVNRNVEVILRAFAEKKLDFEDLITHEYKMEEALEAYEKLAEPDTGAMAVLLTYS